MLAFVCACERECAIASQSQLARTQNDGCRPVSTEDLVLDNIIADCFNVRTSFRLRQAGCRIVHFVKPVQNPDGRIPFIKKMI